MNSIVDIALSMQLRNAYESRCPYCDRSDMCNASICFLLPTANERATYCDTENYDNCPIFLSKVLRRR
ncbi:MAG: hypothetical protein HZC12_08340 [Nitrospirae bacterium]|nr:hypothetical protein [Nitrospirota bacterium]